MPRSAVGRYITPQERALFEEAYSAGMRELPRPAHTHDVPTAYGQVRAYRFGAADGAPIVLLHGRNGTAVSWAPNIPALAARRPVYALDLLGDAGASTQTAPIRDAADQAAWLTELLDGLGIDAAHLLGVSAGGWLACNQAVRAPERVASVSLLDPINTFARLSYAAVLRTIPTLVPGLKEWALPRFLAWVDGQGVAADDDPVGRVIAAAMRDYRTALPVPALFSDDELRSIRVPLLAVVAGRSVMHDPRRVLQRAQELVPHAQAEIWPDATHAISGQFADRVNARVLDFLEGIDVREGS